jgi:hypothetical protein
LISLTAAFRRVTALADPRHPKALARIPALKPHLCFDARAIRVSFAKREDDMGTAGFETATLLSRCRNASPSRWVGTTSEATVTVRALAL